MMSKTITKEYQVEGMTCGNCVAKVQKALSTLDSLKSVEVKLSSPQVKIESSDTISIKTLQETVGDYKIIEKPVKLNPKTEATTDRMGSFISTYKPLLLIVGFILGTSLLVQYPFDSFSWMLLMRHFMAGFFIVFSFFKLLNIEGFANSYQMYDLVAAKWKPWGFIYPFVELALGILYLINVGPVATNMVTLIVLGVSSIGVIKSNLDKKKIKCACLGDVFNLPMSTVTIVEDLSMVAMAGIMLFFL